MATTARTARTTANLHRSERSTGALCAAATLLDVDQCANGSLAADRVRFAIAESGVDRSRVVWRPVHDHRSATAAGFAGSPTLLINGFDPNRKSASIDQVLAALRAHLTGFR